MRGLLVGRFQPFHRGHLFVVQQIRSLRPEEPLILGLGSAQASYTWENPFTAGERTEMIARALDEAGLRAVTTVPIVDIDRHALWVAHVESLLPPFDRVYTNNPLTRLLFERARYTVESPPLFERERFEGARIRQRMAAGEEWSDLVPPATAAYLESIQAAHRLRQLARPASPRSRP